MSGVTPSSTVDRFRTTLSTMSSGPSERARAKPCASGAHANKSLGGQLPGRAYLEPVSKLRLT